MAHRRAIKSRFVRRKRSQGIALIVVVTVLAILTTTTVDFAFNTRVQLHMAANVRDELRAYYLALSGFHFSRLVLAYQKMIDSQLNRLPPEIRMMVGDFKLWKMLPLESDFLNGISRSGTNALETADGLAGSFAEREENPPPPGEERDDFVQGFGEFQGNFYVEIDDENRKVNLVYLRSKGFYRSMTLNQLWYMIMPSKYNFMFENVDPDGQYTSREELLGALVDWIDNNDQSYNFVARNDLPAPEDAYYQNLKDPYRPKNAPWDSISELQLVRGVGDTFMRIFGDKLTIYPGDNNQFLNVCGIDKDMMVATLCAVAYDQARVRERQVFGCDDPSGVQSDRFWEEFMQWYDNMMSSQIGMAMLGGGQCIGWNMISSYLTQLDITLPRPPGFDLDKVFGQRTTTFRIKSHGKVGTTERLVTAVIYNMTPGGQLWYFRED